MKNDKEPVPDQPSPAIDAGDTVRILPIVAAPLEFAEIPSGGAGFDPYDHGSPSAPATASRPRTDLRELSQAIEFNRRRKP